MIPIFLSLSYPYFKNSLIEKNLSQSKNTLDEYLGNIFKELIKKANKEISINFKKYKKLNNDIKISLLNESIKDLKKIIMI